MLLLHSHSYRNYPAEEAFQRAAKYHFDGLHLHGVHFLKKGLRHRLIRLITLRERYHIPIKVIDFQVDAVNPDAAVRERSLQAMLEDLPFVVELGVSRINMMLGFLTSPKARRLAEMGSALATDAHFSWCADILRVADEALGQHGLEMTLETHPMAIHDLASTSGRLIEMTSARHIKLCLDPANIIATRIEADSLTEEIFSVLQYATYMHLKNARPEGDDWTFSVSLADGYIDYRLLLGEVFDEGYKGDFCLEYGGAGDPSAFLSQDILYLREILAELKPGEA